MVLGKDDVKRVPVFFCSWHSETTSYNIEQAITPLSNAFANKATFVLWIPAFEKEETEAKLCKVIEGWKCYFCFVDMKTVLN